MKTTTAPVLIAKCNATNLRVTPSREQADAAISGHVTRTACKGEHRVISL
jgi:hypothetical protein